MAQDSKIEWTDHTFNPWTGCTRISPGCDNCYAESWSRRSGHVKWGNHPRKKTTSGYWKMPLKWNSQADAFSETYGRRQRVFCASLSDVFDNKVDPAWRQELFELIRQTSDLDWLLLTKRPQNIVNFLPSDWGDGYANVWLGTTAEDQLRYEQRWRHLRDLPAAVRFISYEPAIGPLRVPVEEIVPDWLIVGGESGHNARSMEPTWVRQVLEDCRLLGVAPFFKQWGTYHNNPLVAEQGLDPKAASILDPDGKGGGLVDGEIVREFPTGGPTRRVTRIAA